MSADQVRPATGGTDDLDGAWLFPSLEANVEIAVRLESTREKGAIVPAVRSLPFESNAGRYVDVTWDGEGETPGRLLYLFVSPADTTPMYIESVGSPLPTIGRDGQPTATLTEKVSHAPDRIASGERISVVVPVGRTKLLLRPESAGRCLVRRSE